MSLATTHVTVPLPPALNKYWRRAVIGGRVRTLLSRDARAYKARIAVQAAAEAWRPCGGPIALEIVVYERRRGADADARIKALFDALEGHLFGNDRQVVAYHVRRDLDHDAPRVECHVRPPPVAETCSCAKCEKARAKRAGVRARG